MSNETKPPVAKNPTMACPRCGRSNYETAEKCWLCFQGLNSDSDDVPQPYVPQQGPSALKILAIIFGALGIVATTVVAGFVALFVICIAILAGA